MVRLTWYAALAGTIGGLGLIAIWIGVSRPVATLGELAASTETAVLRRRGRSRFGAMRSLTAAARQRWGVELELCEESAERFVSGRLLLAIELALLPLLALGATVLGVLPHFASSPTLVFASIVGGAVGWGFGALQLKAEASRRRQEFTDALATYTDLVGILVSGGSGIETALRSAAAIGNGPAFRHLNAAIDASETRREPPWGTLLQLGERLDIDDLVDFGSSMELAAEGSHIVDALQAKAAGMRERDMNRDIADAEVRSEAMVLPISIMLAGVFILIGFPVFVALTRL